MASFSRQCLWAAMCCWAAAPGRTLRRRPLCRHRTRNGRLDVQGTLDIKRRSSGHYGSHHGMPPLARKCSKNLGAERGHLTPVWKFRIPFGEANGVQRILWITHLDAPFYNPFR
jgi:hypothetical protein